MQMNGRRYIVVELSTQHLLFEGSDEDCQIFIHTQDVILGEIRRFGIFEPHRIIIVRRTQTNRDYEYTEPQPPRPVDTHVSMEAAMTTKIPEVPRGKRRK